MPYHWGKNEGCGFALGDCMANGVSNFPGYFCNGNREQIGGYYGCTYDHKARALCSLYNCGGSLSSEFDHFGNGGSTCGEPLANYCPMRTAYSTTGLASDYLGHCDDRRGND